MKVMMMVTTILNRQNFKDGRYGCNRPQVRNLQNRYRNWKWLNRSETKKCKVVEIKSNKAFGLMGEEKTNAFVSTGAGGQMVRSATMYWSQK